MKPYPFWKRLYFAFFPDKDPRTVKYIFTFDREEDEFWAMLNGDYPGWTAIFPFMERSEPRVIHYHDIHGDLVAICVRWPNRNYYYTVKVR
ncbi:hypothetical protein FDI85_gp180 [Erwinia phage Machina]|uniref:Uncharacterized protein n=2 Tax=Machinavirus machina TaxID=2169990 RepID=A0A1B2ID32_9CAUD|nr:hypothetical protein BIZ81_gp178 [Erwinia phage vB_EamM_Huxley]YP_009617021.1 hypothetical protein FDI85_gp180 [Erwinia phage Machina]ANZ49187.1 hypothetical protein HUXLEY_105 [Erwinia phage vB_EamM_Huxley]ANZ49742.1 hypothetical protein MACHINA_104 [Erwinia phage Machina]ANZ50015.1 hypothetical protein PARSHIK_106 [Erwinia phage vB_EamM_Parshik]